MSSLVSLTKELEISNILIGKKYRQYNRSSQTDISLAFGIVGSSGSKREGQSQDLITNWRHVKIDDDFSSKNDT